MTRSCAVLLLAVALSTVVAAETLGSVLRSRHVSTNQFAEAELAQKITSWAASSDEEPFLLAYYTDDGSGLLRAPLHIIRYDSKTRNLRRADLQEIAALFDGTVRMDCLGSALAIGEHRGVIHINTHGGPSAGCLLLLSQQLALKTTLSGWLLGMVGDEYALVQRSEIHFAAVHPMRIAVYDFNATGSRTAQARMPVISSLSPAAGAAVACDWNAASRVLRITMGLAIAPLCRFKILRFCGTTLAVS